MPSNRSEIWEAVTIYVCHAAAQAGIAVAHIAGIAFDAICSLVVTTAAGDLVTVSPRGDDRNIIVWMGHRDIAEADEIN